MKTTNKILIGIAISLLFCAPIYAQTYNEQIDITAPYQPSVNDANKLNIEPDKYSIKIEKTKPNYNYTFSRYSEFNNLPGGIALLQPVNYDFHPKKHILSAVFGFGSNIEPLIDIDINSTENEKASGGFNIYHNSAWRQMDIFTNNPINNSFNITQIGGYGGININKQRLDAKLSYTRNGFYYYGTNHESTTLQVEDYSDSLQQTINIIDASLSLFNAKHNTTNYKASVNYSFVQDINNFVENIVDIPIHFNTMPEWIDNDLIAINLNAAINTSTYDDINMLVNLQPTYRFTAGSFDFMIGFNSNFYNDNDKGKSTNKFAISPKAEIKANIIKNILNIHIGVDGNVEQNTFKSLYMNNQYIISPYIAHHSFSNIPDSNGYFSKRATNTKWDLYAGFDSKISNYVNLSAQVEYKIIENAPIYTSLTTDVLTLGLSAHPINMFTVKYADMTQLGIIGDLTIDTRNKFLFNIYGRFNINENTNVEKCEELYNMPNFNIHAEARYKATEKLIFGIKAYCIGSRKDFDSFDNTIVTLKPFYDIDLSVNYLINDKVSIWGNINNLFHFNNTSQIWYGYNTYPINAMAGIRLFI